MSAVTSIFIFKTPDKVAIVDMTQMCQVEVSKRTLDITKKNIKDLLQNGII